MLRTAIALDKHAICTIMEMTYAVVLSNQRSAEETNLVRPYMVHAHGGPGENPLEIQAFADTYCKNARPMIRIIAQGRNRHVAWVKYESQSKVVSAVLNYSSDSGKWSERKWQSIPCLTSDGGKVTVTLPDAAKFYYINLTDERGLLVSSEYDEIPLGCR